MEELGRSIGAAAADRALESCWEAALCPNCPGQELSCPACPACPECPAPPASAWAALDHWWCFSAGAALKMDCSQNGYSACSHDV